MRKPVLAAFACALALGMIPFVPARCLTHWFRLCQRRWWSWRWATVAVMAADMEVGIQVVWEGTAEMARALEAITLARPHAITV